MNTKILETTDAGDWREILNGQSHRRDIIGGRSLVLSRNKN